MLERKNMWLCGLDLYFTFMANSAQRRVVGTSRQIEMNENITLVISDPFLDLPTGLGADFGQGGQEQLPVSVVQEDRFPAIAPAHQMINRSRILQTKLSRHGRRMPPLTYSVNPQCGIARN
jgi:hypothetical protein